MTRTTGAQPATANPPGATRPGPAFWRTSARHGWAWVRLAALVIVTGLGISALLAIVFAALVVAVGGKLP